MLATAGLNAAAIEELTGVLPNPDYGNQAAQHLARLKPELKYRNYEWTSWREQEDWNLQGDWSIADGRLQQQVEGVDSTAVQTESTYAVQPGFHLAFDLTVMRGDGLVAAELVQDEKNVLGVSFGTGQGYLARKNVNGKASNVKDSTFRLRVGKTHHIELSVSGGTLKCNVDGKALPELDCSTASKLSGNLRIKLYQLAVQIDNIQMRAAQ